MINHLMLSPEEKAKKSQEVHDATVARYDWNDCAKAWMDYIDSYKPKGLQGHWDAPPKLFHIPDKMPENIPHTQLVEWLFNEVLHQPEDAFGYEATKLLRDLNIGAIVDHGIVQPIDREKIFQDFRSKGNNKNMVEKLRVRMANLIPDKFIEVANEEN